MGVEQKLKRFYSEGVSLRPHRDRKTLLSPEMQEYARMGDDVVRDSIQFLEQSGIKLALYEFNQDMLCNLGSVSVDSGYSYLNAGEGSLDYFAQVVLRWRKATDKTAYSLVVSVEGDLLDTYPIEDGDEEHVKSLSISFFRSTIPTEEGDKVESIVEFGRPFDIFDPLRESDTYYDTEGINEDVLEKLEELEKPEPPKNTYKNWVEANIANFISFSKRELHESPVIRETA